MSIAARNALVDHPHTIFQADSQREDLRDPERTKTQLIAFLLELVGKGHILLFTAIKSDHHDDSAAGEHCHFNGYCADVWPLASTDPTDYLDASDSRFQRFLHDASLSPWLHQIGLAGSSECEANRSCAGPTVFEDSGGDHVHLGSQ